jgi:hypothetical protein
VNYEDGAVVLDEVRLVDSFLIILNGCEYETEDAISALAFVLSDLIQIEKERTGKDWLPQVQTMMAVWPETEALFSESEELDK